MTGTTGDRMRRDTDRLGSRSIARNIWHDKRLRGLLVIMGVIVLFGVPGYGLLYLVPSFHQELLKNVEQDASRTTVFLSDHLFENSRVDMTGENLGVVEREITRATRTLLLEKVRIFSKAGVVVYSTDKEDVGTQNDNAYFDGVVRMGNIYSKVARKETPSAEGRVVSRDVAEVYVPIMSWRGFEGAVEIYYDITEQMNRFDRVVVHSIIAGTLVTLLSFGLLLILLARASKTEIKRREAEAALQMSNLRLEGVVHEQTEEIIATQRASIIALATLAEYHDLDTGGHLERIERYVGLLSSTLREDSPYADYLDRRADYVGKIMLASVLHDIGKVIIAKEILMKPGKLAPTEFAIIKQHPLVGGDVLRRANNSFVKHFQKDSYLAIAREIALHHHEKWDGSGYPHGLRERDIPLSARIVAIADVYDALRSRRPYKEPWSHEDAAEEIIGCRGTHFDPALADAFLVNEAGFARMHEELPA